MAKSSLSAFSPQPAGFGGGLARMEPDGLAVPSLSNLWQMPLLLVSLGIFTLAAYLFIDPRPAADFQTQLAVAQREIDAERYDAAVGRLNDLLAIGLENSKEEAETRLLLAEALDLQMRRNRRAETPQMHRRIVTEINAAYAAGAVPSVQTSDRLARSYEVLDQVDEAAANWGRAVDLLEQAGKRDQAVPMRRSIVEMLIAADRTVAATEALKAFLNVPGLSDDERAWALGELARMSIDADEPAQAKGFLAAALALSPDEAIRGQVHFRMGYAAWRLGEDVEAEKYLKQAREQLGSGHQLDAEACYLLGRIAQNRESIEEANRYYEIVLIDHPQSRSAPSARLGRGVVRLLRGQEDAGVADLIAVTDELRRKPSAGPLRAELLDSLRRGSRILSGRARYEQAIELLTREQSIEPEPAAEFFARLGLCFENFAAQMGVTIAAAEEAQRPTLENRVRALQKQAGDAYVAYSRQLALIGDKAYGQALWKGVELYERAGDLPEIVAALELFCADRPADPMTPDAMHRLGYVYQALGQPTRATDTFLKLRSQFPQSSAAAEAAVPLAKAYAAQGEEKFPEAAGLLLSITDGDPILSPESPAVRQAMWELGQLYYRMGRYDEALARLEEYASRYETGDHAGQLTFLKADCYRLAAAQLQFEQRRSGDPLEPGSAQIASFATDSPQPVTDDKARRYLQQARSLYDQALEIYRLATAANSLDKVYERMAYFYRADCLFDLGQYEEAIKQYDAAAFRYQEEPASVAAYVQIVNAYNALGRPQDAEAANARALWLLKRIPAEAFKGSELLMSRQALEQWLRGTTK